MSKSTNSLQTYPSFEELESVNDVGVLKGKLRALLIHAARTHVVNPDGASATAYHLAGLLSLDLVRQMESGDPYRQLLEMAGQLEMPKRHQEASASWWRFVELVKQLD